MGEIATANRAVLGTCNINRKYDTGVRRQRGGPRSPTCWSRHASTRRMARARLYWISPDSARNEKLRRSDAIPFRDGGCLMQMEQGHAAEGGSRQPNLSLYRYAICPRADFAGGPLPPLTLEPGVTMIYHAFQW